MKNVAFTLLLVGDQYNLFLFCLNVSSEFDDERPIFVYVMRSPLQINYVYRCKPHIALHFNAKTIPIWRYLCGVFEMDIVANFPKNPINVLNRYHHRMHLFCARQLHEMKTKKKQPETLPTNQHRNFMFCT